MFNRLAYNGAIRSSARHAVTQLFIELLSIKYQEVFPIDAKNQAGLQRRTEGHPRIVAT